MNEYKSFTEAYVTEIEKVLRDPQHTSAPRGQRIRESLCQGFSIVDPLNRLPFTPGRSYNPTYFAAEIVWYMAGLSSLEWIAPYAPFWTRISDDGITCNSAYGSRIFVPAPIVGIQRSQWDWVRSELEHDPDSRRAYVHIRTAHDSFNARLDVPCTIGMQFIIRDGRLHMWTAMRSQDMILGLGNDIPAFTMFHELMALQLGVQPGTYHHTVGSMHIYERDAGRAEAIVANGPTAATLALRMPKMPCPMPADSILRFEHRMRSGDDLGVREQVANVANVVKQAGHEVDPYWADIVALLGAFWLRKHGAADEARSVIATCAWDGWSSETFKQ